MLKNNPNFIRFVQSWVSNDDWRDSLRKPTCYESGWVASTNAHKLLWFHDPEFVNREDVYDYTKNQGVGAENIMTDYKKFYEGQSKPFAKINVSDLEKVYEDIKMIPEYDKKYKTCDECDGEGEVECDCCGHVNECSECDGDGEIECGEEENGHYIYPPEHFIKVHGVHLSLGEIRELIDNLKFVGIEELEVYATNSDIKCLFGIPNEKMYILIMGNMVNGVEKAYDINLNTL